MTTVCERCDAATGDVQHWHDESFCNGVDCGGWLCANCAESIAQDQRDPEHMAANRESWAYAQPRFR